MKNVKIPNPKKYKSSTQGLTIIYFGNGKGKTTAALGAVLRAVGYDWQCHIYQFIKGPWPSGERDAIKKFFQENVTIEAGGKGFVGIQNDRLPKKDHKKAARELFERAISNFQFPISNEMPNDKLPTLVVLDELLDAVELGFVSQKEVTQLIKSKPDNVHLIITGHKKYPTIFAKADLVTEMKKIKHPFDKGYLAQKGLDY